MNPMSFTDFNAPQVHQILDPQHGLVAASFSHPPTWQAQSQLVWNFQHTSQPVRVFGRVADPATGVAVEFFPLESFCWVEPNMGFQQPGQDTGKGQVLMPPMASADVMIQWVIPRYRNTQQARIVGGGPVPPQQLLPQHPPTIPPPANRNLEGVCVQVEFSENGRIVQEEFYGLRVSYPGNPAQGMGGMLMQYNWGFETLFSFRAPQGQLEAARDQCWQVVRSFRLNPQWERVNQQVLQQMQQQHQFQVQEGYGRINDATRLSQQISQQNQQFWNHQQQQRDAAYQSEQWRRQQPGGSQYGQYGQYTQTDAVNDMLGGQETYHDPYYQYGSQHTGYHEYVWTDSQGNYQYSDDPNFNPNLNSSGDWTLMRKKQVGE